MAFWEKERKGTGDLDAYLFCIPHALDGVLPNICRHLCIVIHVRICNERRNQEHGQSSYGVLVRQDLQAKFYGPSGVWQG
jgi:hypothetical protein